MSLQFLHFILENYIEGLLKVERSLSFDLDVQIPNEKLVLNILAANRDGHNVCLHLDLTLFLNLVPFLLRGLKWRQSRCLREIFLGYFDIQNLIIL